MSAIELNKPRVIVFDHRKRSYQLTIKVISDKEWLRYFEGIESTSENQEGQQVNFFDSSAARVALLERNLIGAAGYPEGVTDTQNWQQLLPMSHRLSASNALVQVGKSADAEDDEVFSLGFENVFLDAVWTANDAGDGMIKFHKLRHQFRTPTAEHQRRFSRDAGRSRIVGGSRTGKTQWLGGQPTLIKLYDELIENVDGYSVDGASLLGAPKDKIVLHMDAYHKVAAANELFSPAAPLTEE